MYGQKCIMTTKGLSQTRAATRAKLQGSWGKSTIFQLILVPTDFNPTQPGCNWVELTWPSQSIHQLKTLWPNS